MANDVEIHLIHILQTTGLSLQLDESTLCENEALLLAYVRFTKDGAASEELLFAKSLVTDTRGESIFEVEAAPGFSAGGAEGFQGGHCMRILCSEGGLKPPSAPRLPP